MIIQMVSFGPHHMNVRHRYQTVHFIIGNATDFITQHDHPNDQFGGIISVVFCSLLWKTHQTVVVIRMVSFGPHRMNVRNRYQIDH